MCYRLTIVDYTAGILARLHRSWRCESAHGAGWCGTNMYLLNNRIFLLSELIQRPLGEFAGAAELDATPNRAFTSGRQEFYRTSDGWVAIAAILRNGPRTVRRPRARHED